MSIRRKLLLSFGSLGLLAGLAAILIAHINRGIQSDITQISQDSIEKHTAADTMQDALQDLRLHLEELLSGTREETANKTRVVNALTGTIAEFERNFSTVRFAALNSIELAKADGADDEIADAQQGLKELDDLSEKFSIFKGQIGRATTGTLAEANTHQLLQSYDEIEVLVKNYLEDVKKDLVDEIHAIQNSTRRAIYILTGSFVIVFAAGLGLAWFISRSLTRPIGLLANAAHQIGEGHLDTVLNLRSRDEFGLLAQTFNRMTADLRVTTVSKNYVDNILKSMVNTLMVTEPDGRIRLANPSALRLLGYAESELVGQPLNSVLGKSADEAAKVVESLAQSGSVSDLEVAYRTKGGNVIPMSLSASALRKAGAVTDLVYVAEDITRRKLAEVKLENVHKELLGASRQAGMAEVATSVLHNVGNVLNSVNVSASLVADRVSHSKLANLVKVNRLLRDHEADFAAFLAHDPQGRQIPAYLNTLAEHLTGEQDSMLLELESLRKNIEHIKDIVTMQQDYSKVYGVAETQSIVDLVEDALRMNAGAFLRHDVNLVRDYQDRPMITVEKHKVLQILVNIMRNAKYACDESGRKDKQMKIRVTNGAGTVKIAVIDNGVGIPAENLSRIFAHGFTTRKDGHGYGLHSGALAAQDLGGTLTASSDGPDQGATFVLELPIQPEHLAS